MAAAPDHMLCARCNLPRCDLKVLGCGCHLHAVRLGAVQIRPCCLALDHKLWISKQAVASTNSLQNAEVWDVAWQRFPCDTCYL